MSNPGETAMQLAGTDVSIEECVDSGYGIVKWAANVPISRAKTILYFQTVPEYDGPMQALITTVDIKDLIDEASGNAGFKGYVDWDHLPYPTDPDEYDGAQVAGLAAALEQYCGYVSEGHPYSRMTMDEFRDKLYLGTDEEL